MIEITTNGTTTKILINGMDVSEVITKVEFVHGDDVWIPTVKLTFAVGKVKVVGSPAIKCNADMSRLAEQMAQKITETLNQSPLTRQ